MLRKRAEQFEEFLQRAEQGEKAEEPWAGLVQTAQEVARLAPVPPPPRRLSPGRQRLLTEAVRLREGKATQRRRVVPIMSKMKLASVVVAMLLFFAAVSGTGYALADDSLPGEPLYGLKGAFEQARVNLTRDPQAKAELAIDLAQLRLEEVAQMLEQGQTVDQKTANRVQEQLRETVQEMKYLGKENGEALRWQYQNMFRYAHRHMQDLLEDLQPEEVGAAPQLLLFMSRAAAQYQYQAGTADEATSGAQTQTQQGPSGSQGSTDAPGTGSQLNAQDGLGPYQPWDTDTPWGPSDDDGYIGHWGPGQSDDDTTQYKPGPDGEDTAFGPGPGQPPDGPGLGPNAQPSGPGTGNQTGDGTQIKDGVNGQNQNSTTGPGTGGVNSGGNDGGTNGGSNGGSGGSSGGGGH